MSDLEIANAHATTTRLDQRHYGSLLEYVNSMRMEYCSAYENIPQVQGGTLILPPLAHHLWQVNLDSRTYSIKESHVGNSHIQFYIPGDTIDTGYIKAIWELPLERVCQFSFLVWWHQPLSPAQLQKTPYAYHPCSNLQTKIVKVENSNDIYIIEQWHIICHLAVYKNLPRTFGLTIETMTICCGLNRRWRWRVEVLFLVLHIPSICLVNLLNPILTVLSKFLYNDWICYIPVRCAKTKVEVLFYIYLALIT